MLNVFLTFFKVKVKVKITKVYQVHHGKEPNGSLPRLKTATRSFNVNSWSLRLNSKQYLDILPQKNVLKKVHILSVKPT